MAAAALLFGLSHLGFDCRVRAESGEGGAGDDAGADAATAAPTCSDYCACMTSACAAYPFAPDCMTACAAASWDLTCRTNACEAARATPETCAEAAGQRTCP